jgi:phosphate transport system substrate-binding protein
MRFLRVVLASCAFASSWCLLLAPAPIQAQTKISLVGSGSNVPINLYTAWNEEFNKRNTTIQTRYLSMSTVEGIRQISEGSGDFAAGEIPLTHEEMHGPKVTLIQIPTVLVGIVPIYNLPHQPELHFSGELLAEIFLGKITNWKDSRIAKLNSGATLPDLAIKVVHRTPGKGSNYVLTDFLSKVSAEWRSQIGKSPSPKWPVGEDANRGEDMVEKVATNAGAIGYVELNFARRADIGYGDVQNAAGQFVKATPASISAACAALEKSIPPDFRVSLTNAPGKGTYPVASFTWLYLPASGLPAERSQALKTYVKWALEDGQNMARSLGYATLPPAILSKAQAAARSLP